MYAAAFAISGVYEYISTRRYTDIYMSVAVDAVPPSLFFRATVAYVHPDSLNPSDLFRLHMFTMHALIHLRLF